MTLTEADIENCPGIESATFSKNKRKIKVSAQGMLDETAAFMADYGFVVFDIRNHGDQVWIEFGKIIDL